ncbi:MAG: protein-glutamate O-methyltransferase CheR [Oscillospiraceae bacterium]|jgi:chemotaxis protein methyltransferase CheR|nr:protein-glutamate O-methyltransferase CheR [Oscillospiraceae bacterium]
MEPKTQLHEKDFENLWKFMYEHYGINLQRKKALIEGRLALVVEQSGYMNFHDYVEAVLQSRGGELIENLVSRLTTNYTYFMRESEHYDFMRQVALPEWTGKIKNGDLRVWSAGCSSGEEPYSIAMTIDEYLGFERAKWDTQILATDISPQVLDEAKRGVYPELRLRHLSAVSRARYFTQCGADEWKISDELASQVVFGQFNLMDSFEKFRRPFHIIFCRNVMIYFDVKTRNELATKFRDALEPGGYMFLGMSEIMSGVRPGFQSVAPAVFRKI